MVTPIEDVFTYSNVASRRTGPVLRVLSHLVPAIGRVQAQAAPFAQAWRSANLHALASDGPLWVALGDSLTQGVGAPAYDRGWVGQVRDRLAASGRDYRVVNLAVSGARVTEVESQQIPALYRLAELGQVPSLITLLAGSNDLVSRRRKQLPAMFSRVLDQVPPGTVVATLPNPTRTARALNALIVQRAAQRGLVVAETRVPETTHWRGKLASDRFHPNERGYASIADVFERAILGG